jgi:Uma2 family endonuclease
VVTSVEAYGDGRHRLDAADVLLAAEVVSPGSKRADRVTKPMRYAKAGITRYWVIDLDEPTGLAAFELVDDVYEPVEEGVGTFELTWPVRWSVDLNRLTRRR